MYQQQLQHLSFESGHVFSKYGRRRKAVPTLVWVSDDMQQIHWRDAHKDKSGDFVLAVELQEIIIGFSSAVFRKHKAGMCINQQA
jgi:hypothetical protein